MKRTDNARRTLNTQQIPCKGVKEFRNPSVILQEKHTSLGINFADDLRPGRPRGVSLFCDDCQMKAKASREKYYEEHPNEVDNSLRHMAYIKRPIVYKDQEKETPVV